MPGPHTRATICGTSLVLLLAGCLVACGGSSQQSARTACSFRARSRPHVQRDLAALVDDYELPGGIALVCTPAGTTRAAAGFSDLRSRAPVRPDDRFRVGSVTKTFVATVVLQLVGEGKLRLGDTVERRLPGVVPRGRQITIRELLNHTSGIPDYFADPRVGKELDRDPRRVIPTRTLIARAVSHPLDFPPGRDVGYSNTNYRLLGLIVEKATGHSIRTELTRRIFEPLHLTDTTFESPRRDLRTVRMRGYEVGVGRPRDVTTWTAAGEWADGAIVSSARDVARFFSVLLAGELLRPREMRAMKTVAFTAGHNALGLFAGRTGCRPSWTNGGVVPGYLTVVYASGDGRRVVVMAANGVSNPAARALDLAANESFCRY